MLKKIKWCFDEEDANIIFLLKTLKKEHLDDTLHNGTFCFNCPTMFNASQGLLVGQQDRYDSYETTSAIQVTLWPIVSESGGKVCYGSPQCIAKTAKVRMITETSRKTPMCCFRKVKEEDLIKLETSSILKLGNLVDRIMTEFGHDAYILVLRPRTLLERLRQNTFYFARSIHYGEKDCRYQEFLDKYPCDQVEMFQKDNTYAWQREFRIILPAGESSGKRFITLGSIEDIAIGGDVEQLRNGLLIANEAEVITDAVSLITGDTERI